MPEAVQVADFDATINFLKQDLASVDIPLALNYIAQWEHELQGTELFQDLMDLKQAILNGNLTDLENTLHKVSENTIVVANDIRRQGSTEAATRIEQIGQLLAQASRNVR